ncbi:MAG: hypothetical protein DMF73_05960 [Acidobacteria bacterium]|nr:MAG: hypothetical protein DMF73_05960 [Acidobacteriota bacterium]
MNRKQLSLLLAIVSLVFIVTASAQKQDQKWTEWSKKDAQKVLDDSPWGQIQTDTDTSQMFYSPTSDPRMTGVRDTSTTGARISEGATNQAVSVKFHVRLFSARPIRQALARIIELDQKPPADFVSKLHSFAEFKAEDSIIVTVSYESNDQRAGNSVMQAFNSAVTATLKNNTYLQRSDGKQLFLEEYVPPGKDGFGARFIFLREMDGKPFISGSTGEVRFFAQLPGAPKIDRRFKVADLIYQGELEY